METVACGGWQRTKLLAQGSELLLVSTDEEDVETRLGELPGELEPDVARRTRDGWTRDVQARVSGSARRLKNQPKDDAPAQAPFPAPYFLS